jgi:hypothetical protein
MQKIPQPNSPHKPDVSSTRWAFRMSQKFTNSHPEVAYKVASSKMLISEASSLVRRDAISLGEVFSTAVLLLRPSDP